MTPTEELLADLAGLGIEVVAQGDRLRYRPQDALTPEMIGRLKIHKAALLAILGASGGPGERFKDNTPVAGSGSVAGSVVEWEDCVEPPEPCSSCGGISFWWNPLGDRRCMTCKPPATARKLRNHAQRIRRRHGIPIAAATATKTAENSGERKNVLTTLDKARSKG